MIDHGVTDVVQDIPAPEFLFKILSWSKKGNSQVRRLIKDIGCPDETGAFSFPLETEAGRELTTTDEFETELAQWRLLTSGDNRSRKWNDATPEEREAMSEREALHLRQCVHLFVSLPEPNITHALHLGLAVRDHLVDTLGAAGHRYFFAVHTHDGRPHAHIVARVRSMTDREGRTRQLHYNPADCDATRTDIARRLRELGVEVSATSLSQRLSQRPGAAAAP